LAIRVTDTSQIRILNVELKLHFQYDQDPIMVPMTIEIYPCNSASFTAPNMPPQLLIDREPGESGIYNMNPTYNDLFVSSVPVQCPLAKLELLDNQG
jgi:hypothetical protein